MKFKADEIASVLQKEIEQYQAQIDVREVGRVLEVGDGIARVSGLPDAAVNELLEFEGGTIGLALNLDEESIGAVILGEGEQIAAIEEGSSVRATGRIQTVPVGDELIGRVVNALVELDSVFIFHLLSPFALLISALKICCPRRRNATL